MITLVEALNYRCLRYVTRPLTPFHVLVGPNASGKSTFLDVIGFLGDMVSEGLDEALAERGPDHAQLLFQGQGGCLELAVEAKIPAELRQLTLRPDLDTARYQVAVGFDETGQRFEFKAETLMLKRATVAEASPRPALFPMPPPRPMSLQVGIHGQDTKVVINKVPNGNDNFYREASRPDVGWSPSFKLGSRRSALGNLLADAEAFPVATWFRGLLVEGVQRFALNSLRLKAPSPPTRVSGFLPDGSNLPWAVARLRKEEPERRRAWVEHLRTALPDLVDVATFERPEDRHCYMIFEYAGGLKAPSWLVSDGTLRLAALTLPAYLGDSGGIYLVEEPENGVHPKAVSTMYDSLSSVYDAQVLLATHSPVVLNAASREDVLCFARDDEGATDVVLGTEHPALREWHGNVELGTLLAAGVLG